MEPLTKSVCDYFEGEVNILAENVRDNKDRWARAIAAGASAPALPSTAMMASGSSLRAPSQTSSPR